MNKDTHNMIVPSVCSIAQNLDVVQVSEPRLLNCAAQYAKDMGEIVGAKFEDTIYSKMTRKIIMTQFDSKAQVVLNIGPGSSGTTSMFTAMRMLNVTSRHYTLFTQNCQYLQVRLFFDYFGNSLEPLKFKETER